MLDLLNNTTIYLGIIVKPLNIIMHKSNFKAFLVYLFFLFSIGTELLIAQINTPRPSPSATISQGIGLAEVKVSYSRPQVKGRKIFGDLVPFDKIWRTGANSPTKVTIADTVLVNGNKLIPGDYALYTIPGQSEWTVIFGKNPTVQAGDFKEEQLAARFKVKPEVLTNSVESFTINFSNVSTKSADFEIQWEKTGIRFKVENNYDARVVAQIEEKTAGVDPFTYYQAASYYYDNNKDLNKALEWVNKATQKNPMFFQLYLKAQIQQKLKDCKGAVATAQQSIELSKKANNGDFVRLNEKLIAECSK